MSRILYVLVALLAFALLVSQTAAAAKPVKLPPTSPSATGDQQFVTPAGNTLLY
jgi:hypothetical protein